MKNRMGIEELPWLLKWQETDKLLTAIEILKREHLEFLTKRIVQHANQESSKSASAVIEALGQQPPESLRTILNAPETCHQIYRAPTDGLSPLWTYLYNSIKAEQFRQDAAPRMSYGVWSATGDRYFSAQLAVDRTVDKSDFSAPCYQGIVIDTASPFTQEKIIASKFKPSFGASPKFSENELEEVSFKCFCAIETLSSTANKQWQFVRQLITTVMPRKDIANYTFKGSSNRGIIGRANLINPHLEDVDFTVIANSLIHEAIHILLYMHEEQQVFFSSDEVAFDARLRSPWSGSIINPRAYVHGAFVWFGLYQFWLKQVDTAVFSPRIRDHFLDFCSKGYRHGAALDGLKPFLPSIRSDVRNALEQMQDQMTQVAVPKPSSG